MPAMPHFQDQRQFQNSQKIQTIDFKIKLKAHSPSPGAVMAKDLLRGVEKQSFTAIFIPLVRSEYRPKTHVFSPAFKLTFFVDETRIF
jgi:hypothetical protein